MVAAVQASASSALARGPSGGRSALLRALLAARAAPDEADASGWTPLMWAAQRGDYQACGALLSGGADVNCVARDGACALFCATRADREPAAVVRFLLGALADPARVPVTGGIGDHMDPEAHRAIREALRAHALAGRRQAELEERRQRPAVAASDRRGARRQ